MKSIIFVLTLILCGCEGAYKISEYEKGYQDGFNKAMSMCIKSGQPHLMDTVILNSSSMATWEYDSAKNPMRIYQTTNYLKHLASKIKVDSIVFHYDSILVLHYNQSEVK